MILDKVVAKGLQLFANALNLSSVASKFVDNGAAITGHDFPDANIQWSEGSWWAFATSTQIGGVRINIQVATSADYQHWEIMKNADGSQYDALPNMPTWANASHGIWGPDVVKLDNGTWIMYFAARVAHDGSYCTGFATSYNILGPWNPWASETPLICPDNANGAFGGAGFKDWEYKGNWDVSDSNAHSMNGNSYMDNAWSEGGKGGKRYIVYKLQNANRTGGKHTQTPLTLQEVDAQDAVTLIGEPITLLDNAGGEDEGSIEGASLYKTPASKYVLVFTGGNTRSPKYTTYYAIADQIAGPYVRQDEALLATGMDGLIGPGSADVSWDGQHMVFHSIPALPYHGTREMWAAEIQVDQFSCKTTLAEL